ncbi:MAG: hypothetical protein MCSN_1490 [Candidatus Microsyncoccus archaeolyticus]|nr:MAG: hypothetical protein MCSN_1490 [Candidatus Parcubacteria bacterium]
MNKKLLALSIFSVLTFCAFGIANVMASETNLMDKFQERFGITLTDEQKAQIQTKQQEMETKRSEELAKWQSMTLEEWKTQEIQRINSVTQEEFDKMKEQRTKMLQNNGEHRGGRFGPMEGPAE